ncbi:SGNH/GDSL hydrolase family protein [Gordonia sp. ABSL49_1]|uniref:SGNH/GDSL hydrolase family protein n=1 Tax=Gordonia sp. ABSL49_1 TaxID=2920941 RepID=UPI001F0D00D2|nr:SGNH/GDSL hydrolase family protein [Gordonia sp. ABSL49_1]MCH5645482.1 SGNH/GDSL hydrolase family protein [Gordonia sp. ABSL49_1]
MYSRQLGTGATCRRCTLIVLSAILGWILCACANTPTYVVLSGGGSDSPSGSPSSPGEVIIIGDSSTAGTKFGGQGAANWATIVVNRLADEGNVTSVIVDGKGGSGYLKVGLEGTTFVTETDRLVDSDTVGVLYFGSSNDVDVAGDVATAVSRCAQIIKQRSPNARVIAVGPAWSRAEPYTPNLLDYVATLDDAWGAEGATFVDPLSEDWLGDRVGMVGGDGVHPTDRAHSIYADRMYPLVKQLAAQRP